MIIHDDGAGNLIDSSNYIHTQSYGLGITAIPIGNISYTKGLAIITDPQYAVYFSRSLYVGNQPFTCSLSFTSSYTAYENEYICIARKSEFNWTDNKSAYTNDGNWKFKDVVDINGDIFVFKPFATAIGLYDDANTLVAYGKFSFPIKIEKDMDTIFIVNFDT